MDREGRATASYGEVWIDLQAALWKTNHKQNAGVVKVSSNLEFGILWLRFYSLDMCMCEIVLETWKM